MSIDKNYKESLSSRSRSTPLRLWALRTGLSVSKLLKSPATKHLDTRLLAVVLPLGSGLFWANIYLFDGHICSTHSHH
ncbi:hypothetical protein BDV3_005596 [Batrachochytrium dendrobatidis]